MNVETFAKAAGISATSASRWYPHILKAMTAYHIDTPKRQAAFIAQIGTESAGFTTVRESFNYSAEGLRATFPTRITLEVAAKLGRKPGEKSVPLERQQEIANLLYGGRYGNNLSGDGWKFRGHGLKQITFKDNFLNCGKALGLDLIANPDLLFEDEWAAMSAGWFWSFNGCSMFADVDDFVGLTKKINGGTNGLKDRQARWKTAKLALRA